MALAPLPLPDSTMTLAVKQLLKHPPLFVEASATVAQAAQAMQSARVGSVLVASEPPGIVTDRDLRGRVLAASLSAHAAIHQVMTQPVQTIDASAPAFAALRLMLENNIHHLPVTENGQIVGVVSATDLLLHQGKSPIYLRGAIDNFSEPAQFAVYAREVATLVATLFHGGLGAFQIGQIVSTLNDALVRRLIVLATDKLGRAPTSYAWIVFGSEGRLEQALLTDQDNALIYAESSDEARSYFTTLAQHIVEGLIHAGFPPCAGGFMATNWCKPLPAWQELFTEWIRLPKPEALLDAAIFFDFRVAAGSLSLAPLDEVIASAQSHRRFLAYMARGAMDFRPPLGFFNRLRSDNGKIDLKAGGIAPIVGLARVTALAAGASERSTLARLALAGQSATLIDQQNARLLAEIFPFLLQLRLRRQLLARERNEPLDHKVSLTELSMLERRQLKEAFVVIKQIQQAVRAAWRLDELV